VDYTPEGGTGTSTGTVWAVKMTDVGARLMIGDIDIGLDQVQAVGQ
jgi:hypothetical protein